MTSKALDAALADIDTVFNGFAAPTETGCERCWLPEETAYLRTPYTAVPADLVRRFGFESPGHFEDHAAVMRRLLPQTAHAMAEGTLDGIGWGQHGLSRVDWRAWPSEQAAAVEAFVHAWWDDTLTTPKPPYPAPDVLETCAAILGDLTPLLDRLRTRPVLGAHVVSCARAWLYDLITDDSPFRWWYDGDEVALVTELRSWLSVHAPACLRAEGEPDLAKKAELLALPYDERWEHPYWTSASATN
ncbi:hypothetical protein ACH3Y9_32375 [Streptomyces sp. WSLK1-5]|uniref:hypothetical protein n=1 Tax=unclassified Streptomyces TaxID=2593676 RepID=UPI000F65447C|nr:hypothetical protein [Streptomyces sp. RP5T]RRR81863.1 hypothetical protein EHS43_17960 [Streptomyces sp. RP5T]